MPNSRDAKLLQGLVRQARENRLVYLIFAERRLILPEAQAPQPDDNVHDGAHNREWRTSSAWEARVSRVALGFSGWSAGRTRPSKLEDELMKSIILTALIACFAVSTAAAQSCDSKAVSANGKPLHGAAKMSFVKKCKRDACGSKAVSAEARPLHGAAKNSFTRKCMTTA